MHPHLLSDQQVRKFVADGFHIVEPDVPAELHETIAARVREVAPEQKNSNAFFWEIPELRELFTHPQVVGALRSLLGDRYRMHCHRHAHVTNPGEAKGGFHQDGSQGALRGWCRPWRRQHRPRTLMLLYFPHDVPVEMGGTGIVPGSQYFDGVPGNSEATERATAYKAGTMVIVHHGLTHRARPNWTDSDRVMLKFLFSRTEEPTAPSWNAEADFDPAFEAGFAGDDFESQYNMPNASRATWAWLKGEAMPSHVDGDKAEAAELINTLEHGDEPEAIEAAYALGSLGAQACAPVVPWLTDEHPRRRNRAGYALFAAGASAIEALTKQLASPNEDARASAADALNELGLTSLPAFEPMLDALSDEAKWVRHNAAQAFIFWGQNVPDVERTRAALQPLLSDDEPFVRFNALMALASLCTSTQEAAKLYSQVDSPDFMQLDWLARDSMSQIEAGLLKA